MTDAAKSLGLDKHRDKTLTDYGWPRIWAPTEATYKFKVNMERLSDRVTLLSGVGRSIFGRGAHFHIFVFTHFENNRFLKKLIAIATTPTYRHNNKKILRTTIIDMTAIMTGSSHFESRQHPLSQPSSLSHAMSLQSL